MNRALGAVLLGVAALLGACASASYEGRWVIDRPAMRVAAEQQLAHRMGPERARKEVATGDTGVAIDMMGVDLRLEADRTFTYSIMGPFGEETTGAGTWRETDEGVELIPHGDASEAMFARRDGDRLRVMQGDRELPVVLKKR